MGPRGSKIVMIVFPVEVVLICRAGAPTLSKPEPDCNTKCVYSALN